MKWEKLGRIIEPSGGFYWNKTHAMLPVASHIEGSVYKIFYSGRDEKNISHIGYAIIDLNEPGKLLDTTGSPVLSPGQLGCFDDNGVSPSCIVDLPDRKYLYYIGWKPRCTTRMSVVAGLAESTDGGESFTRVSRAPILQRTDQEPFGIMTAPWVLTSGALFRMWYVSGIEWVHADLPRYNIKYAESDDGIVWRQDAIIAIDSRDELETSLARPCVIESPHGFRMWYSYKYDGSDYRMGYAESVDGIEWQRRDQQVGISTSSNGWDSIMVEYGHVFLHDDQYYMLYNGNGYGESGAGLAILAE